MGPTNVELLYQEWQWLVSECASAMSAARCNGASQEELRSEERRHGLRIDAVYARLKQAEARSENTSTRTGQKCDLAGLAGAIHSCQRIRTSGP
jgi:hypothetical protein